MSENYSFKPFSLRCGNRLVAFDRPVVMGILNVTPDSFYDGGRYLTDSQIVDHAGAMLAEGADIIDVGAVSSRPGAALLPPDEEAERLVPVVEKLVKTFPDAILSVDTCYALPATAAIGAGAHIVNDISGGMLDPEMYPAIARLGVPYILMHNQFENTATDGKRLSMNPSPHYEDLLTDVTRYFSERLDTLHRLGVSDVVIDPGFGFAKTLDHNYRLFAQLTHLKAIFPNTPLLVAVSRKSMIYKLLDTTPDDALIGTAALHAAALLAGAQLLRVHDVKAARQTIDVITRIQNSNS